jgi:hypothetical protein
MRKSRRSGPSCQHPRHHSGDDRRYVEVEHPIYGPIEICRYCFSEPGLDRRPHRYLR